MVKLVTLLGLFTRTILLFMVVRTNSLDVTLQKINESVSFDKSEGCEKFIYLYLNISIEKFKKSLKIFEDRENQVFDAVIYDIMYYRCDGEPIVREKMIEIFGGNFFNNLKEIEEEIKVERHFLDILIGVLNRTRS